MKVQDILKTSQILKAHMEDNLSSALSKVSSAHDAVFVFDDADVYQGVINPYYVLVKSTYPWDTKLKNCLFHPPKIHLTDPFDETVRLMVESKLHYLPVFDDKEQFVGITSARKLLSQLANMSLFHITIRKFLEQKEKPLVVMNKNETIAKALEVFRDHEVSKIVMIDDHFAVQGIFTYYDLVSALKGPKTREHYTEGVEEVVPARNEPIMPYIHRKVDTLKVTHYLEDALKIILQGDIGGVVIVDEEMHAVGIVTVRDFMNFLKQEEVSKYVELTTQNLSPENAAALADYLPVLNRWINKITDLVSARLIVREEKNGGLFKVTLHLLPDKGNPLVIEEENHNLLEVLKKVKKDHLHEINHRKSDYQ